MKVVCSGWDSNRVAPTHSCRTLSGELTRNARCVVLQPPDQLFFLPEQSVVTNCRVTCNSRRTVFCTVMVLLLLFNCSAWFNLLCTPVLSRVVYLKVCFVMCGLWLCKCMPFLINLNESIRDYSNLPSAACHHFTTYRVSYDLLHFEPVSFMAPWSTFVKVK